MKAPRVIGLDILRICSMVGIVGLHIINQGLLDHMSIYSVDYYVVLLLIVLFFSSVNIFGIMSGYLNVEKKSNKYSRIVELILIMIFYCIIIPTIFYIFDLFNVCSFGIKELVYNYFPVLDGRYWYICCYIFLFMIIPYLNFFLDSLTKENYKKLLLLLFILLTILPNCIFSDIFRMLEGLSPWWLIYCYMIGGYLKKYNFNSSIKSELKKFFFLFLLTFILNSIFRNVSYWIFHRVIYGNFLISYTSPLNLAVSFLIFNLFLNIRTVNNIILEKLIIWLSKMSFSVYIIHSNRIIYDNIFKNLYVFILNYKLFVFFVIIFLIIFVYLLCCLIDEFRLLIFRVLKINKFKDYVGHKLDNILN